MAYIKFHDQHKKTTAYRLLVCLFTLISTTDVMSISRSQQRLFPLFLLAAAKTAISRLTVKRPVLLTFLTQRWTDWQHRYGQVYRGKHPPLSSKVDNKFRRSTCCRKISYTQILRQVPRENAPIFVATLNTVWDRTTCREQNINSSHMYHVNELVISNVV